MKPALLAAVCSGLIVTSACSMLHPAPKPDTGPAGKSVESKANPPFMERFQAAPPQLYDLETIAGTLFEGINKENWPQAESGLFNLQSAWDQTKPVVGDKKGVKEADEALIKLSSSVMDKKVTAAYESLSKFMNCVSVVGKSYKLSPIADIITVGNAVRDVSFYVEVRNWLRASSKVKGLDDTWGQVKPSMEQFGVLGAVTTTHSSVKQLKDAVNAENKGAAEEHITNLNESLGRIREYYRGK